MGWKASAIVINTINEETNFEEILNSIGFNNLEKIEDLPFDSAIYPEENTIYVGIYKGNLIITARNLPLYFIDPGSNIIERRITQLYPETEIYALSLNSVINHWAFAIIQNGKKIRIKAGDMDQGTVLDVGQPLEQELELLSKSRLNSKGEREYYFGDDGEFDREHQVGESFVFDIFKRYTGERLDMDDELFETVFLDIKAILLQAQV